jgi:hypothetical protein
VASAQVLDRKRRLGDINSQLTFGENEGRKLSIRLQLNERDTIGRSCDYLIEIMVLEKLKHLKSILSMILISSSECE